MCNSFEKLLKNNFLEKKLYIGALIKSKVIEIQKDIVLLESGLKSESKIDINQFMDKEGKIDIKIGSITNTVIEALENGFGQTILSREKAEKIEVWKNLENIFKENQVIKGKITNKVKGGFAVNIENIKSFLPKSLSDFRIIKNLKENENEIFEFKIIKMDKKRNNIVISRKAVVQNNDKNLTIEKLKKDQTVSGIIKNITDYGAFIDLGGLDGLLHITDISWKKIKNPSEVLKLSQEVKVKILNIDKIKNRISLGLKQLQTDPWTNIIKDYKVGQIKEGKITNITDYGFFVSTNDGIEGLVHNSEISWDNQNLELKKKLKINNKINVTIIDIDKTKKRLSFGIKQSFLNPWVILEKKIKKENKKIVVKTKSINEFGIFVKINKYITGLIHNNNILLKSLNLKNLQKKYKKNKNLITNIISINTKKEKIYLSIKNIVQEKFNTFINKIKKEKILKIKEINEKTIKINIKKMIFKFKKNINIVKKLNNGNKKYIKILNYDKKNKIINLKLLKK